MLFGKYKKRLLVLVTVVVAAGWLSAVDVPIAGRQLSTTSPTLSPLTKNIFFPSQRFASGAKRYGMLEGEFVLSATMVADNNRSALLNYPLSNSTRWISEGDYVGDMEVRSITTTGIEVERFGKVLKLTIGAASSSLDIEKQIFTDSFQLIGIGKKNDFEFAIVKAFKEEGVYQVRVGDFIGSGLVTQVEHDAIVLKYAGSDYKVPVGGRFTPEGKIQ